MIMIVKLHPCNLNEVEVRSEEGKRTLSPRMMRKKSWVHSRTRGECKANAFLSLHMRHVQLPAALKLIAKIMQREGERCHFLG